MLYCSFLLKGDDRVVLPGRVIGDVVEELAAGNLIDVITSGGEVDAIASHGKGEVRFVAPITRPTKIVCVGLNYRAHIKEFGHAEPSDPVIFSKPSSSIIGPGDNIVLPKVSTRTDYEGEVAMIIGKQAKKTDDGSAHIFGYTCFNDVTARDIQKRDSDWTRAKGFDTFSAVGPFISTKKPDWVRTFLNGEQKQYSLTSDMVFGFETLVEYISRVMTLYPGDIIATGTPFGVGKLNPFDKVIVEAEGIGLLENMAVPEK
jgi:2-keto-4-pentenoate hydratase/2-oxohepta-3-ene-1,7-dioic acid hydratase in catechol pathway